MYMCGVVESRRGRMEEEPAVLYGEGTALLASDSGSVGAMGTIPKARFENHWPRIRLALQFLLLRSCLPS